MTEEWGFRVILLINVQNISLSPREASGGPWMGLSYQLTTWMLFPSKPTGLQPQAPSSSSKKYWMAAQWPAASSLAGDPGRWAALSLDEFLPTFHLHSE